MLFVVDFGAFALSRMISSAVFARRGGGFAADPRGTIFGSLKPVRCLASTIASYEVFSFGTTCLGWGKTPDFSGIRTIRGMVESINEI